ncbi:MAG: hypothetical protein MJ187_02095 [Alphaproteobacteria bacterium]|nr:hypothetical protein [Alphaproteobacteria bacterium]
MAVKTFDNITSVLRDDLEKQIQKKSKLAIAASYLISKMRAETQLNKQIEIKHKITELKGKING